MMDSEAQTTRHVVWALYVCFFLLLFIQLLTFICVYRLFHATTGYYTGYATYAPPRPRDSAEANEDPRWADTGERRRTKDDDIDEG
jgi:hypothetical protein